GMALEGCGADAAIRFRLDAEAGILRAAAEAGQVSPDFVIGLEVAVGRGASGLAVAEGRPVWTPNLRDDPGVPVPDDVKRRMGREGLRSVLAVPLLIQSGGWVGCLSRFREREAPGHHDDKLPWSPSGTQDTRALQDTQT